MELKTVLLAEDNPLDAELTLEALNENNFANEIIWVKDGVEAMEYLTSTRSYKDRKPGLPVLLILDLKMPRMDGIEVLEAIRNKAELKFLPIVMLTSSREEQDLVNSYKMGVNAYVVKPVDFNEFVEAIKQLGIFWVLINELPKQ